MTKDEAVRIILNNPDYKCDNYRTFPKELKSNIEVIEAMLTVKSRTPMYQLIEFYSAANNIYWELEREDIFNGYDNRNFLRLLRIAEKNFKNGALFFFKKLADFLPEEVISEAVKINGNFLRYIPVEFYNDRQISQNAVDNTLEAVKCLHYNLRNDFEFMKPLLERDNTLIRYCGPEITSNRETMKELILRNSEYTKYISYELKNDREFLEELLEKVEKGKYNVFFFSDNSIRKDKSYIRKAISCDENCYKFILKNDDNFRIELLKINPRAINFVSPERFSRKGFVSKLIKEIPDYRKFLTDTFAMKNLEISLGKYKLSSK